jgi:hypothetical protein
MGHLMRLRNVIFALLGAGGLVAKHSYAGPLRELVHSYGGNLSVSFALYYAVANATERFRRPRLVAALVVLAAVTSFELTNGFGVTANVYDPVDLLANAVGVGVAVLLDPVTSRLFGGRRGGSVVKGQVLPRDGSKGP